MAENGNLKDYKNKTPSCDSLESGRTENDAIHHRLRGDLHSKKQFICQSCHRTFEGTSLMQVYEHYGEFDHKSYYRLCFYCGGRVHQYYDTISYQVQIYHNCLRWKRGEDK